MPRRPEPIDRAEFFKRSAALFAVTFFAPGRAIAVHAESPQLEHPDPRRDITADHVLADDAIGSPRREKDVFAAYAAARAYPAIFDGLACGCGCTGKDAPHRSLLTCYESKQPTGCISCQQEALLVGRLAKDEKTLAEIRTAVDKKYR